MTRILAAHPVLAPHRYPQNELTEAFADLCGLSGRDRAVLSRLHSAAGVSWRNLAVPVEDYATFDGFGGSNDAFITVALSLGADAISGALDAAGFDVSDVDLLVFTTVTGVAVPSIDARLASRMGFRSDVKRLPLFGLGCVGGAAGIARVHDYLRAWPTHTAVLLSVELCSLTLQRGDSSVANLVGSALFGDGAAAVVLCGSEAETSWTAERLPSAGGSSASGSPSPNGRMAPTVVATRSVLYPDSERVMGWDVGNGGFEIVLGADVPDVVRSHLGADVKGFLADHDLTVEDIATWVSHPGGPKVLDAVAAALSLPPEALRLTWESLAQKGNLSSASVLHVLHDTLALQTHESGAYGLMLAMGPGFCSELVLLQW